VKGPQAHTALSRQRFKRISAGEVTAHSAFTPSNASSEQPDVSAHIGPSHRRLQHARLHVHYYSNRRECALLVRIMAHRRLSCRIDVLARLILKVLMMGAAWGAAPVPRLPPQPPVGDGICCGVRGIAAPVVPQCADSRWIRRAGSPRIRCTPLSRGASAMVEASSPGTTLLRSTSRMSPRRSLHRSAA
jgi:hypothetical protein